MPAVQSGQLINDLARRWHALAERRLAYYNELYRSGRWRRYYVSQEKFAARMLEVIQVTKIWAELAGQRSTGKDSPPGMDAAEKTNNNTDNNDLRSAA